MPVPHQSTSFADLLDPRFQRIFDEEYQQLESMLSMLYTMVPHNGRNNMMWSSVGTLPDFTPFRGLIDYGSQNQGYDVTATYEHFSRGIQIERTLFKDDQYNVMDQRPRALAAAAARTREKHAARMLNMAFSVDTYFYDHSEGVALVSDSHTTTSGASTASGFDNKGTADLSAAAVQAARIQMRGFRGDQAELISITPDELWHPPGLEEAAYEIIATSGKVDTMLNNRNISQGRYTAHDWDYLTDANNWFMVDSSMKRNSVFWVDREELEFGAVEDFDTMVAKFRAYMRYANAYTDWRWIYGSEVS